MTICLTCCRLFVWWYFFRDCFFFSCVLCAARNRRGAWSKCVIKFWFFHHPKLQIAGLTENTQKIIIIVEYARRRRERSTTEKTDKSSILAAQSEARGEEERKKSERWTNTKRWKKKEWIAWNFSERVGACCGGCLIAELKECSDKQSYQMSVQQVRIIET